MEVEVDKHVVSGSVKLIGLAGFGVKIQQRDREKCHFEGPMRYSTATCGIVSHITWKCTKEHLYVSLSKRWSLVSRVLYVAFQQCIVNTSCPLLWVWVWVWICLRKGDSWGIRMEMLVAGGWKDVIKNSGGEMWDSRNLCWTLSRTWGGSRIFFRRGVPLRN